MSNMRRTDTLKQGSRSPNSDDGKISLERAAQLLSVSRAQVADAKLVMQKGGKKAVERVRE